MPSYKNLAVLALAASSIASPALAAPTLESQNQARTDLEARVNSAAVKTILTQFGLSFIPTALLTLFGGGSSVSSVTSSVSGSGNGTKRATEASEGWAIAELEGRALAGEKPALSTFSKFILGSIASILGMGAGSVVRKDVSPEAILAALSERDIAPEDVVAALRLFSRALDELD